MKSSKKILGASAALGLAVALSAGSTFAWFTAGKTSVDVNSFNLSATTDAEGMDLKVAISLPNNAAPTGDQTDGSAGSYGYSVKLGDATAGDGTLDKALYALQSTKLTSLTLGETDVYASATNPNKLYSKATGEIAEATGGYITFRLVFWSSVEAKIYLNTGSAVSAVGNAKSFDVSKFADVTGLLGNKINGSDNATFTDDIEGGHYGGSEDDGDWVSGGTVNVRAANAARIMFVENKAVSSLHVWCPNEYNADGGAETSATTANSTAKGFWKNNLAGDYNHLNNSAIARVTQKAYTGKGVTLGSSGTLIATTKEASVVNQAMIAEWDEESKQIQGTGYYSVVDLTIWLEGTDGDCFDAILGDTMSIALNFKATPKN